MSLSNGPGDKTLTRTFQSTHSWAIVRLMLSNAAFEAP